MNNGKFLIYNERSLKYNTFRTIDNTKNKTKHKHIL